jgi:hypothetical protein
MDLANAKDRTLFRTVRGRRKKGRPIHLFILQHPAVVVVALIISINKQTQDRQTTDRQII